MKKEKTVYHAGEFEFLGGFSIGLCSELQVQKLDYFITVDECEKIIVCDTIVKKTVMRKNRVKLDFYDLYTNIHLFTIEDDKKNIVSNGKCFWHRDANTVSCTNYDLCVLYKKSDINYTGYIYETECTLLDGKRVTIGYLPINKSINSVYMNYEGKELNFCIYDMGDRILFINVQFSISILLIKISDEVYLSVDNKIIELVQDKSIRDIFSYRDLECMIPYEKQIRFDDRIINNLFIDFLEGKYETVIFNNCVAFTLDCRYIKGYMRCTLHYDINDEPMDYKLDISISSMIKSLRSIDEKVYMQNYKSGKNIASVDLCDGNGQITYFYSSKKLGILGFWSNDDHRKLEIFYDPYEIHETEESSKYLFMAYGYAIEISASYEYLKIGDLCYHNRIKIDNVKLLK